MRLFLPLICTFLSIICLGQDTKNERETRIKKEEVPLEILKSVEAYLDNARKVRFYRETDNDKKSYEVKLTYQGKAYSIEFDQEGTLEDIEVNTPIEKLSQEVKKSIIEHLGSYEKFRIDKTQKQFSSSSKSNREIIDDSLLNGSGDIIRYELEVDVKQKGKWTSFEMLFASDGSFLSRRTITHRSSEFILY